ncbi:MAG: 5'-3' exonuclease [Aeromicrobium sp.]|uniref:5'-3' exonuclease n=1 Tax=Aeromicrobium sp. TaxID=1871063 RepID=UPI00262394C9|nr:5'-3' exonuclease [Aeromicrobium sp.]MDF1705108.1 5'-3' exonuclease [Aeromicrobium sp.]
MAGRLLLLDTASLYYRAFFGIPDSLTAPDGTVVNALRGMIDFTATLIGRDDAPEAVVACWDDDWRPQWRVDLVPSYKTQRLAEGSPTDGTGVEETPDLLAPQVPLIAEALGLAGLAVIGAPEAEADDVIGTLAHRWDGPVDVVTGDRDLFQLVDDARPVRVLYTARGVAQLDTVDAAWIRAKYGIEPASYVDYAVMRGDASDGLPGVAGIGEKTAATLVNEFGGLDDILAAAQDEDSSIKPRPRASLLASRDYVAAARTVVAVRTDLDVEVPSRPASPDREALLAFGERWGVAGPVERLLAQL